MSEQFESIKKGLDEALKHAEKTKQASDHEVEKKSESIHLSVTSLPDKQTCVLSLEH